MKRAAIGGGGGRSFFGLRLRMMLRVMLFIMSAPLRLHAFDVEPIPGRHALSSHRVSCTAGAAPARGAARAPPAPRDGERLQSPVVGERPRPDLPSPERGALHMTRHMTRHNDGVKKESRCSLRHYADTGRAAHLIRSTRTVWFAQPRRGKRASGDRKAPTSPTLDFQTESEAGPRAAERFDATWTAVMRRRGGAPRTPLQHPRRHPQRVEGPFSPLAPGDMRRINKASRLSE
jgi:hypothetical protein